MKPCIPALLVLSLLVTTASSASASTTTPAAAEAMVKRGVAYLNQHGRAKALAEFNNPRGQFVDGALYIFVIDERGNTLANGVNPKLVGKNVLKMKDVDGKLFIQHLLDVGHSKGRGWIDYKWSNQLSHAVESKHTYVERADSLFIACGAYR